MTVTQEGEVAIMDDVYEIDSDKYIFKAKGVKEITEKACDFEEAIEEVGFGKFNILLYIVTTTTGLAAVFDSISLSYIMADLKCDLKLTLAQEGIINAVTIVGMVTTGLFWGFISDMMGRKKLLLRALLLDFMFSFLAALSRDFGLLVLFNFLAGTVTSGAYAALAAYLTELHRREYRVIVQLFLGLVYGVAEILLPLLAMSLLTNTKTYPIYGEFDLLPWNVFLLICSIAPLLSAIGFLFLPESPKFLLSRGRNEEALQILRRVHRINMGSGIPYSVTALEDSLDVESQKNLDYLKYGTSFCDICCEFCCQMRVIFSKKFLCDILLVSGIQFAILLGLDGYKLWMPQLFHEIVKLDATGQSTEVCNALNSFYSSNSTEVCSEAQHHQKEYVYCAIVAAATLLAFLLSSTVVRGIGKKQLLFFLGYNAGLATIALSFSRSIVYTIVLSSVIIPFGNIALNALISVVIVIFPTHLRAMSVAMAMTFGRLGGALGCFVFPILLHLGCAAPLIFLGCIMLGWCLMVVLLPNTESNVLD